MLIPRACIPHFFSLFYNQFWNQNTVNYYIESIYSKIVKNDGIRLAEFAIDYRYDTDWENLNAT